MSALDAVRARQSWSKVEDTAPTREELLTFVAAAGRVADHSSLRPWRLIELRGADREVLGAAIAKAQGDSSPSSKPLRAPLLIAVVASYRKSEKVPRWEQEAVASGVAAPVGARRSQTVNTTPNNNPAMKIPMVTRCSPVSALV